MTQEAHEDGKAAVWPGCQRFTLSKRRSLSIQRDLGRLYHQLGLSHDKGGDSDQARADLRRALALWQKLVQADPAVLDHKLPVPFRNLSIAKRRARDPSTSRQ